MADQPPERAVDERALPPPKGDWSDIGDYSEHVKVWLPVSVAEAAGLLADQYLQSKVIIVRNALVIHVYGRLAFDQLVLNGLLRAPRGYKGKVVNPKELLVSELRLEREGQQSDMAREDPLAHRRLMQEDEIEGATVALRIAVPKRLKRDLEELASQKGKPLSEYTREVLTAYYLGAATSHR